MKSCLTCLLFVFLLTNPQLVNGQQATTTDQTMRLWTPKEGNESYQATLLAFDKENGRVSLRLANDSKVELPVTDFSTKDRGYLKRFFQKQKRIQKRRQKLQERNATGQSFLSTDAGAKPLSWDRPAEVGNSVATAKATSEDKKPIAESPSNKETPNDIADSVRHLYGIDWHSTAKGAQAAAKENDDKPIIWFRVLGDLEDGM